MALSQKTGQCFSFNTAGSIFTPFIRTSCFEPAFVGDQPQFQACGCPHQTCLNCDTVYSRRFHPVYDQEKLSPPEFEYFDPEKTSPFDARNNIYKREYSRVVGYAPRNYSFPSGKISRHPPLYVQDETGKTKVISPIYFSEYKQPNCANTLVQVFAPHQFPHGSLPWQKAKEYRDTIHHNIITPSGDLIPLGVEMDGYGEQVYEAALKKCAIQCGSCSQCPPQVSKTGHSHRQL